MADPRTGARSLFEPPLLVRWATVLFLLLLLVGSILYPLFEVPDEPFHADMVVAAMEADGWPDLQDRKIGPAVAGAARVLRQGRHLEEDAIPRPQRSTLSEFGERPIEGRVNRMTQHPPLYYVVVGVIASSLSSLLPPLYDLAFDQRLWLFRLVSILLLLPIPLITYRLSARITNDDVVATAAAVVPLGVPMFTLRNGPMVNNDNLLVLLAAILLLLSVRIAQGDPGTRTAVLSGGVTGLALLTKGLALVLPGLLLAAYVLGAWRSGGKDARRWLWALTTAAVTAFVVGGWWWFRNLLKYGTLQPSGVPGIEPAPATFQPDLVHWFMSTAPQNFRTFWGAHFVGPPSRSVLFWWLLGFVVIGAGLAVVSYGRRRRLFGLLLLPTVLLGAAVGVNSLSHYLDTGQTRGEHGRYLLSGLPGLSAAVAAGYARIRGLRRWLPATFVLAAISLQTRSSYRYLRAEWGPAGDAGGDLRASWQALLAWAPHDPVRVRLLFIFTVTVALIVLTLSVRSALEQGRARS